MSARRHRPDQPVFACSVSSAAVAARRASAIGEPASSPLPRRGVVVADHGSALTPPLVALPRGQCFRRVRRDAGRASVAPHVARNGVRCGVQRHLRMLTPLLSLLVEGSVNVDGLPSKLATRVRFPSPAPTCHCRSQAVSGTSASKGRRRPHRPGPRRRDRALSPAPVRKETRRTARPWPPAPPRVPSRVPSPRSS